MTAAARLVTACMIPACLTACVAPDGVSRAPLDQAPITSEVLRGEYSQMATCAYQRLDKTSGAGIKKVDLPEAHQSRLALESGGGRHWELVFSPAGPGMTKVVFSVVQTMWGPDTFSTRGVMPEVRQCEGAEIAR